MKLADGVNNAVGFAITAYGAVAIGTVAGSAVGLIALGMSGFSIARCIRHGYKGKFDTHVKAACKLAQTDEALAAFVRSLDDAYIQSTLDALDVGLRDVKPSPEDFARWNLDPDKVAQGLVRRLKNQHNLFNTDANASTLAHNILRAAFAAVSEHESFWQQTELFVAKTVLERTSELMAGQAKLIAGQEKADGKLDAIQKTIDQIIPAGHYGNDVGHHYPNYLVRQMLKRAVPEELWELEISSALESYVAGISQLSQQTNLPADMEAQRKQALELFKQSKLDEGESVLINLQNYADEAFESAARDRAKVLVDRIPFAEARLDFTEAIDLYEQAANTVMPIDQDLAVQWQYAGGILGYKKYQLFGTSQLSDRSVRLFLAALALVSKASGNAKTGQEKLWADINIYLGLVYQVLGERGDEKLLHKAVTAFKNALKEYTRDKAPAQWALTTKNLGTALWKIGEEQQAEQCWRDALTYYRSVNALYYTENLEAAMHRRGLEP